MPYRTVEAESWCRFHGGAKRALCTRCRRDACAECLAYVQMQLQCPDCVRAERQKNSLRRATLLAAVVLPLFTGGVVLAHAVAVARAPQVVAVPRMPTVQEPAPPAEPPRRRGPSPSEQPDWDRRQVKLTRDLVRLMRSAPT